MDYGLENQRSRQIREFATHGLVDGGGEAAEVEFVEAAFDIFGGRVLADLLPGRSKGRDPRRTGGRESQAAIEDAKAVDVSRSQTKFSPEIHQLVTEPFNPGVVMTTYFIFGLLAFVALGILAWMLKRRALAMCVFGMAAILTLGLCAFLTLLTYSDM